MVAVRSPLVGMKMDEQTAAYLGVLERRVTALQMNEYKFLALMEMVTGQKWETMVMDFENGMLDDIARRALMSSLGVSDPEARRMVRENKKMHATKVNSRAEQDALDNNSRVVG